MDRLQDGATPDRTWIWPLDLASYDQRPHLSAMEQDRLQLFLHPSKQHHAYVLAQAEQAGGLERLLRPLQDVFAVIEGDDVLKQTSLVLLLRTCARQGTAFWAWDHPTWVHVLGVSREACFLAHRPGNATDARQYLIAAAYLLDCFRDLRALGGIEFEKLARKVFGRDPLEAALAPLVAVVIAWGYSQRSLVPFRSVVAEVLLANGDLAPSTLSYDLLLSLHADAPTPDTVRRRAMVYRLSRVLAHLHILDRPLPLTGGRDSALFQAEREDGIAPAWITWVEQWYHTSTRSPQTRLNMRRDLYRVGRWLAACHPDITHPKHWTRELAAEFVAAVNQLHSGEYCCTWPPSAQPRGQPLSPRRKHQLLGVLRRSFLDTQEWGWMEHTFNPLRAFATPRSLTRLIGPSPRALADDVWAKLLWAGLNLRAEDIPVAGVHRGQHGRADLDPSSFYPFEMLRALTLIWLFAGLRSDEIVRLRLGCTRTHDVYRAGAGPSATPTQVGLLDVPVNKTGHAFTKPVDLLVTEAVRAWEAVRPTQPDLIDAKTGERVQFVFCYRAKRVAKAYLNASLIPALCQKAGIPRSDARGSISSHRARSTIANQLFNAREPMTLFELQAWLGHQSPASTQQYVAASPTTLVRAYTEAGYFARNVRAIEVLIDQQAITSGDSGHGIPWRYYDLGHGWCRYEFFDLFKVN